MKFTANLLGDKPARSFDCDVVSVVRRLLPKDGG